MTREQSTYQWQWPAGRKPDQKLVIRISSLAAERRGFFRRSPSYGEALPEATIVEGDVVEGPAGMRGQQLRLRAPRKELGAAAKGDLAAIGVDDCSHVICFSVLPKGVASGELNGWLERWTCG